MKKSALKLFALGSAVLLTFASCGKKHKEYPTGLVFDQESYEAVPQKARLVSRAYESLPAAVDLSPYAPISGNQGQYGTCVAWSTTYCAMTTIAFIAAGYADKNKSTASVFSPYYMFRKCNPYDISGKDGMLIETALEFLKQTGSPKRVSAEENIPFENFSLNLYEGKRTYRIGDYATLFSYGADSETKISSVKKSLAEKKPVVISFFNYPWSFNLAGSSWKEGIWDYPTSGGHAMVILAYDDNKNGGSFLFQNSWGIEWGKNGTTWVPYESFAKYCRGAYELSSVLIGSRHAPTPPALIPDINPPAPEKEKTTVYKGSLKLTERWTDETLSLEYHEGLYMSGKALHSGDCYQIEMTNTKPCYVYVLGTDDQTGKATRLFPPEKTSALLDYSENTVVLPAENQWIRLDDATGYDYMIMLYSLDELDFDQVLERWNKSSATRLSQKENLYRKISYALGDSSLIPAKHCNFERNMVSFDAWIESGDTADVMAIPVLVEHID